MSYFSRVSVRDGKDTIARCVDSLLEQTVPPKALIVVDDGSADGTSEILKGYGDKIHVIKTNSIGRDYKRLYRLWNMSLTYATEKLGLKCDYFLSTGGDCRYAPDYAEKLLERMKADPSMAVASGNFNSVFMKYPRGTGRMVRMSFYQKHYPDGLPGVVGYESELIERALINGYRVAAINEARFEHLVRMGKYHRYRNEGIALKAIGSYPPYVLYRCIRLAKDIGPVLAFRVLWEYVTYRPQPSGYYSQYEPELRQAVRERQRRLIFKRGQQ